jgi:hypothetical protein
MPAIDSRSQNQPTEYQANIRAFATRLAAGIIFANLIVLCLVILVASQFRNEREERAKITAQNLSRILEHDITNILDKIDFTLLTVADETERQYKDGGINKQAMNVFMARQLLRIPELDNLRMADSRGDIVFGAELIYGKPVNVADRDYFAIHRNNPGTGLYISKPIISRLTNKWIVVIARRSNHPDGSFLGVVWGTLSLDYISRLFASLNIGSSGGISLRDAEMGIIARYPAPRDIGSIIGNKTLSPELRKLFEAGQPEGTFFTPSSWDNTAKIVSYHKIGKYPLFVNVGVATRDYLAEWRHDTAKIVALALFYVLVTLLLSWALFARYKQEKLAETRLFILNAELEQRVAERTSELHVKNSELESSLARVKQLEGIIPICMCCKKIRDDQNSWQQLEQYITEHSEALFSHGLCPTCAEEQREIFKNFNPPSA